MINSVTEEHVDIVRFEITQRAVKEISWDVLQLDKSTCRHGEFGCCVQVAVKARIDKLGKISCGVRSTGAMDDRLWWVYTLREMQKRLLQRYLVLHATIGEDSI